MKKMTRFNQTLMSQFILKCITGTKKQIKSVARRDQVNKVKLETYTSDTCEIPSMLKDEG